MKNLNLYFTKEDYNNLKGPDWPEYSEFLEGDRGPNQQIQDEINGFIDMFVKDGVKFPIKTATSCQSKWTWSTIYLNMLSTASCHRVNPVPFSLEDFDNFHNIPKKLQDRELMLEGKWPTGGCEYCQVVEDAGGWSDRMHNNEIRNLTPPELEEDPNAISVTPRIVEIFAQNTCNLACTYCNDSLSSKIQYENRKFGHFEKDGVVIPTVDTPELTKEYFEKFIHWLDNNNVSLKRLHLLGGETFLQHDLMNSVLATIEKNPNPELEFCVFSNLNVPDKWWNLYTDKIKQLQKKKCIQVFDLTASIDCWGDEAEYARSGLNLQEFESRFKWAAEQDDWLRLNVNQTVTCLTMATMHELVEKVNQYSQNKHIGHYFQYYTGPQMFQHPNVYPWSFWKPYIDKVLEKMPRRTDNQLEAIQRMEGMMKYLEQFTDYNIPEIKKLNIYLDELDRRRGTDWKKVFPYLEVQILKQLT